MQLIENGHDPVFAAWHRFRWAHVLPYVTGQLAGAFAAAAVLFFLYAPLLAEKDRAIGRGQPGSEVTASCYGEFFPSPGPLAAGDTPYSAADAERHYRLLSEPVAFGMEVLGTLLLALTVFALTDARTVDLTSRPSREAANRLYQRLGFEPRATNVWRLELKGQPPGS